MAQSKVFTSDPIVNGLAVVNQGDDTAQYDGGTGPGRTQHFASGDSLLVFEVTDQRYLRHGGNGGSGAWEH